MKELLSTGHAQHAFFGVQPGQLTEELAQQLGTDRATGVVVLDVVPDSPAAQAGIARRPSLNAGEAAPKDRLSGERRTAD